MTLPLIKEIAAMHAEVYDNVADRLDCRLTVRLYTNSSARESAAEQPRIFRLLASEYRKFASDPS